MALDPLDLAERGQRLGLRLMTRAGSLSLLGNRELRSRLESLLYHGSKNAFQALDAASRRSFLPMPGSGRAVRPAAVQPRSLFDLTPTEDQALLRAAAAQLADEVIRPAAASADTDRAVPGPVRAAAAELGLTLIGVPTALGGIAEERSTVTGALVLEELARGDLGIAAALMAPAAVATAIGDYGTSAQQATYLPAFTGAGEPATAALALMEPAALFDPLAPATTAARRGSDLVLDGTKSLVPAAAVADLFVVSALVDGQPRLVLVEARTRGLAVADDPAMGLRAARTGRLALDGVVVPADNLLGTAQDHLDVVRRARLAWAAAACGTAQGALDQLVPYVLQRHAFGEPIAHRQAVAFALSDIAIELAGLRLVVWRAAARLDRGSHPSDTSDPSETLGPGGTGDPRDPRENRGSAGRGDPDGTAQLVAHARRLTATHAAQIGSQAVQLLGGHGFVKEFDNERWFRDLRGAGVLEGVLLI